jgi:mRNA interferase MazF
MEMKRGQIWWVDLGEPRGSQPGFRRPVLIVQDDLLTDSLLGTVMVVPLTSNLQRGLAIGNVEITAKQSGLPKASVALVCQVMTVDKSLFVEQQGSLSRRTMTEVDQGLALVLGLPEVRR